MSAGTSATSDSSLSDSEGLLPFCSLAEGGIEACPFVTGVSSIGWGGMGSAMLEADEGNVSKVCHLKNTA